MWTIYCHTLVSDGRRYVGQTKNSWQRRWRSHVVAALRAVDGYGHFANAIRKHGSEAFSHEVLEVCSTQQVADLAERCWIALFDTTNRALGFNRTLGGQGDNNVALRRSKNMPEVRAKVSAEVSALWSDPVVKAARGAAISAGKRANPRTSE